MIPPLALGLCLALLAAPAAPKQAPGDDDGRALERYLLTARVVEGMASLNDALAVRVAKDPALARAFAQERSGSLAEWRSKVEANPTLRGLLRERGLTARDVALASLALLAARMGAQQDEGGGAAARGGVRRANAAWVRQHEALVARLEASARRLARAVDPSAEE